MQNKYFLIDIIIRIHLQNNDDNDSVKGHDDMTFSCVM